MSGPARSTTNADGARTYRWKTGEEFPSVTTLISGGVPKSWLGRWAAKVCGEYVADNVESIAAVRASQGGRAAVVDLVKNAPWRKRDDAGTRGTSLHDYAEARALDLPLPPVTDDVAGYVRSFEQFLDDWRPEFVRTEFTTYNRRYCYAGTGDFLARIPGYGLTLGDYKTSKAGRNGHGIYAEAALQLNAYAGAEFIGEQDGTEGDMPKVESLLGVNIRHNGYSVVPIELSDRAFRAFLYVAQVSNFTKSGHEFLGEPAAPPIRKEAA